MKNKICIAISTYKRKKNLINLLKSIKNLKKNDDISLEILIIANDLINYECLKKIFKNQLNIKLVREINKGLSFARNRALKEIRKKNYKYIVFFDDDCLVDKNWLNEMLLTFKKTEPDIIGGPQLSKSNSIYNKLLERREKHNKEVSWVSTNNVIMKSKVVQSKINFSKKLNLIGGEDQLFFKRLSNKGFRIIWNENSKVYETINKDRENLSWFIKRNFRYGTSSNIIFKETHGLFLGISLTFIKSFLDLSKAIFYLTIMILNLKKHLLKSIMFFIRFLGVIFGLIGFQTKEYSK
jgi:GT2 family glycosyltransferase